MTQVGQLEIDGLIVNRPLDDRCIYLEFCDDFFRTQIIERQGTAMYY